MIVFARRDCHSRMTVFALDSAEFISLLRGQDYCPAAPAPPPYVPPRFYGKFLSALWPPVVALFDGHPSIRPVPSVLRCLLLFSRPWTAVRLHKLPPSVGPDKGGLSTWLRSPTVVPEPSALPATFSVTKAPPRSRLITVFFGCPIGLHGLHT